MTAEKCTPETVSYKTENKEERKNLHMSFGTDINAVHNIHRAHENESKREKIASWYITMPGIPPTEKVKLEKSLNYNLGKSLTRFFILSFAVSCIWFFGIMMKYDPFERVTGYRLIGKKAVTAVVQEDGMTASVKNPNEGEHIIYDLTDFGIDPTGYTYEDRLNTYWSKDEDSDWYSLIAVLPEKKASHIETIYNIVMMTGYLGIIVVGFAIFFIRRRIYTGWYRPFYYRMEKFCSNYDIYRMYPEYDTVDAFIAYGNAHSYEFAQQFASTYLTDDEQRKKKRDIILSVGVGIFVMAVIVLICSFMITIQMTAEDRKNEARTAKVLGELQSAIDGEVKPLGESSEYYNFADMVNRAKASFPGETVYYKLQTTDEYVTIIVTTQKKKNVYFDRYLPVDGNVGDEEVSYKLEISMVSDAMQPDDILHNYTGILE